VTPTTATGQAFVDCLFGDLKVTLPMPRREVSASADTHLELEDEKSRDLDLENQGFAARQPSTTACS
jgi:hypothetical protein